MSTLTAPTAHAARTAHGYDGHRCHGMAYGQLQTDTELLCYAMLCYAMLCCLLVTERCTTLVDSRLLFGHTQQTQAIERGCWIGSS